MWRPKLNTVLGRTESRSFGVTATRWTTKRPSRPNSTPQTTASCIPTHRIWGPDSLLDQAFLPARFPGFLANPERPGGVLDRGIRYRLSVGEESVFQLSSQLRNGSSKLSAWTVVGERLFQRKVSKGRLISPLPAIVEVRLFRLEGGGNSTPPS